MNAARINAYLRRHNSPLAGYGNAFVTAGRQNGVSPALLVAIAGAESSFGKIQSGSNNAWGWGPGIAFGSYDEAINTVAKGLRTDYFGKGLRSVPQLASKYVGNSDPAGREHWVNNVKHFLSELGGGVSTGTPTGGPVSAPDATGVPSPTTGPDLSGFALQGLGEIGKGYDPLKSLSDLTDLVRSGGGPSVGGTPSAAPSPQNGVMGDVTISPGANRAGHPLNPAVISFVEEIAGIYGHSLTIGTGTNHNQYVVGTHRQSAHWTGNAADIPASGAALTRLGQDALIAAGMSAARARKQRGGLYNVGNFQIIFNSNIGGNHFTHLHVGIRG